MSWQRVHVVHKPVCICWTFYCQNVSNLGEKKTFLRIEGEKKLCDQRARCLPLHQ